MEAHDPGWHVSCAPDLAVPVRTGAAIDCGARMNAAIDGSASSVYTPGEPSAAAHSWGPQLTSPMRVPSRRFRGPPLSPLHESLPGAIAQSMVAGSNGPPGKYDAQSGSLTVLMTTACRTSGYGLGLLGSVVVAPHPLTLTEVPDGVSSPAPTSAAG